MIQTAGVLKIASYPKDAPKVQLIDCKRWQADHRNAVKWLKQPNLKAEVKRALKPSTGLFKGGPLCPGSQKTVYQECTEQDKWLTIPKVVKFMTHKQLKSELGKQSKRLS